MGAGIAVMVIASVIMRVRNRRRTPSLLPMRVEKSLLQPQDLFQASLSPQIAQILKEAVVQGLAAQRNELLQAQQVAATEINALVHRLDELKAPMQERLRSYEERIAELEKDLAERNEENRELLKLKIEMTRRQLEAERARNRVDFN
jgi:predicted  nucleic acid-binding Zn-ribbon protein